MAEIWGAAIAAAGAIGGGVIASQGAKKAGAASAKGAAGSVAEQARQYNQTRSDLANYRVIGGQALNALGSIYGYHPAATPQSFDQWAAQHPEAYVLPKAPKQGFVAKHLGHMINPLAAFQDAGLIKKGGGGMTGADQAQGLYQQYLSNFDYNGPPGSAPKTNPNPGSGNALGIDSSSGYMPTASGGVRQGVMAGTSGSPVTIDGGSGQVVTPSGQPNDTALGPPMPAGPDYSNFFASPDYQFRQQQGMTGITRSAAARGLTKSGNALAALSAYNSNLAAGEFGNYFNRQAALAGIGQTATNTTAQVGMNAADNNSQAIMAGANARASGIADSANAWGNALGTVGGIIYDKYGRPQKTGGGP